MSEPSLEKASLLSVLKHDMNNALTGVKTGLEIMAMDEFFEDEDNAEDLNDIKKASVRMANMLEDLSLLYGDEPSLRPPTAEVTFSGLRQRVSDQLEMEGLSVTWEAFPSDETHVETHPESLLRALFYGSLFLNELEKGSLSLKVQVCGPTWAWTFSLTASLKEKLGHFLQELPAEGRPVFLYTFSNLAGQRLGATWGLSDEGWSLSLGV